MPIILPRRKRQTRDEWNEVNRLLTFHRLMLNVMIPSALYKGPLSVSIYSSLSMPAEPFRDADGNINDSWVLASTYLPEYGYLKMGLSGRTILARNGLKQAILKTIDFLDWTSDTQERGGRATLRETRLRNRLIPESEAQ